MTDSPPRSRRRRPTRVLVVCEGNICRSPAAELLLDTLLGDLPVRIESAGLGAAVDQPVPERMRTAIAPWGLDSRAVDQHRGRLLTPEMLERSDLVLTMTREQRTAVVRLAPGRLARSVTLGEFARLAGGSPTSDSADPDERLRALLESVRARRPLSQVDAADEDIEDPFGRPQHSYDRTAAAIRETVEQAAAALRAVLTPGDVVSASGAAAPDAPPPRTPTMRARPSRRER